MHPVAPADLLAARSIARVELDRTLDDPIPLLQKLDGDLRLDLEPVRLKIQAARDGRLHHLVAGFHIGEVAAEQHVGQHRQRPVRDHRDARTWRTAREVARSVDDIAFPPEDRLHEIAELDRIELEVGVLNRHDGAASVAQTDTNRAAFAAVGRRVHDRQHARHRRHPIEHLHRAVGGAVVDDDDLAGDRQRHLEQSIDDLPNRPHFVIDRNDDGDEI